MVFLDCAFQLLEVTILSQKNEGFKIGCQIYFRT